MTQEATPVRPPRTDLEDARLRPFQNARSCDLNAMNDAVRLILSNDPTVYAAFAQVRGDTTQTVNGQQVRVVDGRIDFNRDGNPEQTRNGVRFPKAASSHEHASALIATAQIAFERGIRLDQVPADEIARRGCDIYNDFQAQLTGRRPAICRPQPNLPFR